MKRVLKSTAPPTILCIVAVTILIISFNGGVSVGGSNHFGQLPVVRRALDPNYLPGDFTIEIRQYHHRVFTHLIAGLSRAMGEDRALIIIHIIGMSLLASSLWLLCRAVNLTLSGFVAVGLFLASNLIWTGKGLELNHFVGDADIMPPTFAHAFVLLAVTSLLRDRYLWAAVFAGLATLFHLQIGLICAVMIAPLYLVKLKQLGVIKTLIVIGLFIIAATPGLLDLIHMLRGGLMRSPSTEYSLPFYIDFRHPHHFELISLVAAFWVAAHVIIQVFAYRFLRRLLSHEAPAVGKMAVMSLTLAALAIIHFTDYYLIKDGHLATIQFIRLSSLITVFGAVSLVVVINEWTNTFAAKTGNSRIGAYCSAGLILIASLWGVREAMKPDAVFDFGIVRYREQSSHWVNICRWIRSNGPRDAVYLTPPGANGFLSLAERSNVADFKNNPDSGLYLAQWLERLRDLAGGALPKGRGYENRQSFNRAYGALNAEQLIQVGKKYGAEYAVLPKSSQAGFEVLHMNDGYRLVKLPIK
ncbi:MAG TPA: DUF6798 domain-containing protein [Blastocatellia bacterium]|nr:DUF6798 domain-containing protein [Blastocatellia bacterium]